MGIARGLCMDLSTEQINDFQKIYEGCFGRKIGYDEATNIASGLIGFVQLVLHRKEVLEAIIKN